MSNHLVARVGDERFAFALRRVREALDAPSLHHPPVRPDGMLGTMRHRGQTLAVWDGGRAFGIARRPALGAASATVDGTALVLDNAGEQVVLVVDDALDVMEIAPEVVREAPAGTDAAGMLEGVVRDAAGLVGVVRVDVLCARLAQWGAGREP